MSQHKFISISNETDFYDKKLKGQLEFLSKNGFEIIAVAPTATDLKTLNATENLSTISIKIAQGISIFKDCNAFWKLFRLFRKEKPQIVHTYNSKTGVLAMMAARLAGVPNRLHTMQGVDLLNKKGFKRKIYNTIEKWACASATKVYALSEGWKEFIVQNKFVKAEKVDVIGEGGMNGIDLLHFKRENVPEEQKRKLMEELRLTDEDFVFMYAGPLTVEQGIEELIMAFDDMKYTVMGNKPNVRLLLLASTPPDFQSLSPKALKILNQERRIITTDFQDDLRPYFAIADCLIYPSHREGFPEVVLQAGAMGLVSVVADIKGSNEIIDQRINGVIVPLADTEELAMAMTRMKVYDDYRNLMCKNARIMAEKRYEQSLVWKTILEEYKTLLNS